MEKIMRKLSLCVVILLLNTISSYGAQLNQPHVIKNQLNEVEQGQKGKGFLYEQEEPRYPIYQDQFDGRYRLRDASGNFNSGTITATITGKLPIEKE